MSDHLPRPSSLLVADRVLLDVAVRSKKRVYEEAGLAFENTGGPPRSETFRHLLERERLGSTLIAEGVAIPHARIAGLNKPLAGFVRMAEPFPFDSPEVKAKLLFILLVPDRADASHLQILSIMSRMLTNRELVADIERAADGASLIALLQAWEVNHLNQRAAASSGT